MKQYILIYRLLSMALCLLMIITLLGNALPAYAQATEPPEITAEETINEFTEDTEILETSPDTEADSALEETEEQLKQTVEMTETVDEASAETLDSSESEAAAEQPAAAPAQGLTFLDAQWNAKSNNQSADWTLDDFADDGAKLTFTPSYNQLYTASVYVNLNFQLDTSTQSYPAGSVTVTVPKAIFTSWEGNSNTSYSIDGPAQDYRLTKNPQFTTQAPPEGESSSSSPFSWKEDGNEIVFVNYRAIDGSIATSFAANYSFIPTLVSVDTHGSMEASFFVELSMDPDLDGTPENTESVPLQVGVNTEVKEPDVTLKTVGEEGYDPANMGVYLDWNNDWGVPPADAAENFYVIYKATVNRYGTETSSSTMPYTYTVEDITENTSDTGTSNQGKLVGAIYQGGAGSGIRQDNATGAYTVADIGSGWAFGNKSADHTALTVYTGIASANFNEILESERTGISPALGDSWTSTSYLTHPRYNYAKISYPKTAGFYLLRAYPKALLMEASDLVAGIEVPAKVQITQTSQVGQVTHTTAETTAHIHTYPEGNYGLAKNFWYDFKSHSAPDTALGGQTINQLGKPVMIERQPGNELKSFYTSFSAKADPGTLNAATGQFAPYTMIVDEGGHWLNTQGKYSKPENLTEASRLSDEAVRYRSVCLESITLRDAVKTVLGWDKTVISEPDAFITVYIRRQGETAFEAYAELGKRGAVSIPDGATLSKTGVLKLPDNVCDLRYAFTTTHYDATVVLSTLEELQPTAAVQSQIQKDIDSKKSTYYTSSAEYVRRPGDLEAQNDIENKHLSTHPGQAFETADGENVYDLSYKLTQFSVDSQIAKTQNSDLTISADRQTRGVTIIVLNRPSIPESYLKQGEYVDQYAITNGVFYDLLPAGTDIDATSIELGRRHWQGNYYVYIPFDNTNHQYYEFEVADPNYQNSGSKLLEVTLKDVPELERSYNTGLPSTSPTGEYRPFQYTYDRNEYALYLKYTLENASQNISSWGADTMNTVAFENRTPGGIWFPDAPNYTDSSSPTYRYFQDIGGAAGEAGYGFGLTKCSVNFQNIELSTSGISTGSKGAADLGYQNRSRVLSAETYSYELFYGNNSSTRSYGIILFDVLERGAHNVDGSPDHSANSEWQGTFDHVDLRIIAARESAEKNGQCAPVLYYATKVPSQDELTYPDTQGASDIDAPLNPSVWTRYPEDDSQLDKSSIQAIAIDCRRTNQGKPFVLGENGRLSAYLYMRAPEDISLAGKTAVNELVSRSKQSTLGLNWSMPLSILRASSGVTFALPPVALQKASLPLTGTQAHPAAIKNEQGEPILYTITVTNTDGPNQRAARTLTDIVVTDTVPAGLVVDAERITAKIVAANGTETALIVNGDQLLQKVEGQTLTWKISGLAPGERAVLAVPTALSRKFPAVTEFQNTAKIISIGHAAYELCSETMYHQTEPDTGELTVTKTVSGARGDQSKEFTFTVTLDQKDISGQYGEMQFTNGVSTFTLKHGQNKTATGLPTGVSYIVEETGNDGYTVTMTNAEGRIQQDVTATAAFDNYKGGSGGSGGHTSEKARVTLTAAKTLDGQSPIGSSFTFFLDDASGRRLQTKRNQDGSISFDALMFDKTGTYIYYLTEQMGNDQSIDYDSASYKVTITVTRPHDYEASVAYEKNGQAYHGVPTFANTTKPDPETPANTTSPSVTPSATLETTPPLPPTPSRPLDTVPQTEDASNLGSWGLLAACSALSLAVLILGGKRRKNGCQGKHLK